jgi:hypothetical protein
LTCSRAPALECNVANGKTVKYLFFECIVSKLLWDDVFEVFQIEVSDFLSIASKWLCNTRFLQFNVLEHLE